MRTVVLLLLITSAFTSFAYDSGIAIQSEKGTSMQVYVNGKLYNKSPEKFVRVKSTQGLFHVEVKVLNPWNKEWYMVRKDIQVEKGFEFQYKVVFVNKLKPTLVEIRKYPVFTKYFLNPTLYNRHPVS